MVDLEVRRGRNEKTFEALAELRLSLEHAAERMDAINSNGPKDLSDVSRHLGQLHKRQIAQINEMADLFDGMQDAGDSIPKWMNRSISNAVSPTSGVDTNPEEAVISSQRRILNDLDAVIVRVWTDPARSILEHMKLDLLEAHKMLGLKPN